VLYPASSPYVVAVGGTQLFTDSSGNYVIENGWEAGGGGISALESCTSWQIAANVPSCQSNNRGMPDVAMDGALETGGLVYIGCAPNDPDPDNNCLFITGGTSMSSPLALGVWARMQTGCNNKFGYASPQLYQFYQPGPPPIDPGFHDVISGGNGFFFALPGWDFVTGLGSFDIAQFYGLLKTRH
jgi:pseudomonalisin